MPASRPPEPEVDPDDEPEEDPDTEPEADPETDPAADPELPVADPDTEPEADPEAVPDAVPEVVPDAVPEVDPDAVPELPEVPLEPASGVNSSPTATCPPLHAVLLTKAPSAATEMMRVSVMARAPGWIEPLCQPATASVTDSTNRRMLAERAAQEASGDAEAAGPALRLAPHRGVQARTAP